ncbi:MAG: hypothetical protein J6T28_09975 [Paludibacteraceae bacterium]|nr:hypothetical protein [Paludibacteraceae bacterium]
MRKTLFYLFVVISSLSFGSVEAKQKSLFRVENDTILHICSNLSEMDSWAFYERDESDCPYDYFISPLWHFKNIVIDEGVDSVHLGLCLISARVLSIPSSLKYLYLPEVPPGLEEVRLNAKNPYCRWEDGTLYNRDKTQLYFMLPSAVDSVLQFPETVEQVWTIPDRYYQKGLSFSRIWEGYPECSPKDIHYSKIIFPKHCERYPEHLPSCDSLFIQSEHCPVLDGVSYLYCLSDSLAARIMLWESGLNRKKIHSPNFDVRKRDTSWMRESYRMTCVLDNGDTLVGADSIPSGREIESVKIEGIADENVKFNKRYGEDVYRFYVATYDTLYRLPLEVFVKPEEKKPEPTWSDFGEVKDSVLTIREDVDSLPYLRGSFRKVIVPKRTHYLEGSIECDSAFIYSDSLETSGYYENVWDKIDAHYYYVENEELYLSLKRRLMEKNQFQKSMEIRRPAVVYCPHADVRKRNMALQQNTNNPVWRDSEGNIKNLTYRPWGIMTGLQLEIEGLDSQDLYVLDCRRKRFLRKSNGYFGFINDGKTAELEYAVWSYDTLLPLQQKDTVRLVKRDGTPWGEKYDRIECVFYYVPKGMTRHTLLESKDSILMWRSGDTIPRRYANRLAFGMLLTNGDCDPSGAMKYDVLWLDKRKYFRKGYLIRSDNSESGIWGIPKQYKEFWVRGIKEYWPDCIARLYSSMHFYVGK